MGPLDSQGLLIFVVLFPEDETESIQGFQGLSSMAVEMVPLKGGIGII